MKNAKFNFLWAYVYRAHTIEDKARDKAFDLLFDFQNNLPERAQTLQREDEFNKIIDQFDLAFEKMIEKIANCPFVKIEICDQQDIKDKLVNIYTTEVFSDMIKKGADERTNELTLSKN